MKIHRHRFSGPVRTALTLLAVVLSGLVSSVASAVESASLLTFSTEGPDSYGDGTPVLDGEYYALVYQTEAAGDVLFRHSGEPVDADNAVVLRALPRAEGGRCRSTTFAVDSGSLPKLSGAGVLRLYLLDTRVYENGTAVVGGLDSVQASIPVTATCKVTTGSSKGIEVLSGHRVSELGADAASPRITGIAVDGDQVLLTVADAAEGVNYTAVESLADSGRHQAVPATGRRGKPLVLRVMRGDTTAGFFRVQRK